ncbi:MAG: type I methionyl aminopeptidase [Clostridiales bacterium]|nr:type I methionyl aminopeptidase [Clostridiales bacterium]
MIILKNAQQLDKMRAAGRLLHDIMQRLREVIKAGETTAAIDAFAEEQIRRHKAIPSFLNYRGYPKSICTSLDDEVVHGIPSDAVVLQEGSILSVDCGLILDGWQADSAFTVPIGQVSADKLELIRVTEACFFEGARAAIDGNRIGDIGHAVQALAESHGLGVVRDLTGHGIGRSMHEDPSVPNFGTAGHGARLRAGMTIAIEPMITLGGWRVMEMDDGWTIKTMDGSACAHYEHTIAVTPDGPEVLTLPGFRFDGGQA